MKRFFTLFSASAFALALCANVITYTADDVSVFPNPERGFTDELGGELALTDSKNHVVKAEEDWYFDPEDEKYAERQNQSLVMLMYYLKNYKTKDLSNKLLQGFDEDMQALREHGFKCVLRFAYDWNSKNDADTTWALRHIEQLAPHLEANKDVIYVLEAGFVGRWGEWYYSANYGNETQELNDKRRRIIEALLAACPQDRFLLTRYAMIKTGYLGDTDALDGVEAFGGSDRARLGYHNDAFLNAWGNDGTYDDGAGSYEQMRQYIAQETLYVPNGGETNVEDKNLAAIVAQQDTTLAELRRFHWSFCGAEYSEDVTNKWRTNGTFEEMNRVLGYRFQLVNATLPKTAQAGSSMSVQIELVNKGCAPIYNPRPVYLVLRDQQSAYSIQLSVDPRRWVPGQLLAISELVTIPADIPAGTYDLYLHLPDAAASLAADPRYAVRFANVGTWDAATGMNDLQTSVTVTDGQGQGMEQTKTAPQVHKELRNGRLVIRKGNSCFNVLGIKLL